ncbi:phage tail tape measure protein [Maledivibacter halophilus]|uniref:Phage tail tape measure protein, TP901 family, core region n=1 Tax=Maledivibacter halophilus TaxID=36842 RepID=A0A1T5K1D4_9FIRM|nr:phage tail tape measure protein [Maledivibacter halophilus]SKC57592.1 phage tail tape measure protein, TP901 family, core region [Maledivibacter halophilus]
MAKEIGQLNVVVGLDSTGFQNGIGNLNREMKKVQSEFKLASAEMGKHGKELDGLKLKSDSLTKQTELQRQKVEALEAAHQKSVETKGKDAKATQELEIKLNQARTRLVSMEQDLNSLNKEIELQSSGWYQLAKALEPVGQKMQDVGKKMESVGKDLTKKITLPLVGLGAAAVKVGSDFEAGMSEVQSISGATGNDLEKLEEKAKEMGATTKFSASESAEALKYMAMAGWDTNQMLDGLEGVMMLAASSGENLGSVSDIVTDALTAFGMEARQAGEFADLLASASSNSNTNVGLLGESFKYVAPLFGALNYSAEDAALALGLMANAGIKGSQAGTSLKTAIANLANPTSNMAGAMDDLGISITDANGEMLPFKNVMDELRLKFANLSEEQQAQYAATIFGKEAMAGMLSIINASEEDYEKLTQATREYTGTAKEMAETMEDNLQGEITKLKSALEGVGIQIFEILVPHLQTLVEKLQLAVEWFANLSPATQETIVKVAALAAAIGPLLILGGKLIGGAGTVISAFSKASIALAGLKTGAATATVATSGMATGFSAAGIAAKAGALLLNPWTLAIGAAVVGGVALYKHLSEENIPAIELFGDEVSESTKKAVGGFLELNDEATLALNQLSWSGQEVTKEMADGITSNFSQMAEQVQAGLDTHHEESLGKIQDFVTSSTSLSKEEQDEILNNMQEGYENRKQSIADGEARIKEILDLASTEKRALTKEEQEEINSIQREMVDTGIKVLSENEVEAKAIMERMKAQAGEITALQAAEVVKNSIEQKDGAILAAEEQYNDVIKEIIRQRDEAGTITKDQADKLIKEATRQKDESIKKAEEMHEKVVKEAKAQAKEHVNQVDWETGEIKTKWQVMKDDISTKSRQIKEDVSKKWEEIKKDSSQKWENIKTDLANKWTNMKTDTATKVQEIKQNVSNKWSEIKTDTENKWKDIKSEINEKANDIKRKIIDSITDSESEWVSKTSSMLSTTLDKFPAMASKVSEAFSTVVGSIKDGISALVDWNKQKVEDKKATFTTVFENITKNISQAVSGGPAKNFSGTSFFQGGLTMVGELGPELVELPRGSKIYDDNVTKKMLSGDKGITQNIVINSPAPLSPYETARKIKNASKELALEW